MLTEGKLRKRVYEATFKRGSSLFNAGGVLEMEEEDQGDRMLIRAKVQGSGSRAYDVELLMDESEDKILEYDCECPAYASFSGMCKHCVATLLELIHQNEPEYSPKRLSRRSFKGAGSDQSLRASKRSFADQSGTARKDSRP